jgi:hypothetical protein
MVNETERAAEAQAWHEAAKRIDEVNRANGWEAPTFDSIPVKVMLTITELHEAEQGVTGEGKDPLPEELADTAIRLIHILESVWPGSWAMRNQWSPLHPSRRFEPIERLLWPIVAKSCVAVEAWRHDNEADTRIALELALAEVVKLARLLGVALLSEVAAKTEKNAKRGHLHGKARAAG